MNFLDENHRSMVQPHKNASINFIEDTLVVEYNKDMKQNSSGFRVEANLDVFQTYQLDITANLLSGNPAFVYVEDNIGRRLTPRFKIYQNSSQPYTLKYNFITDSSSLVYLGILFYYSDQDYKININTFKIQTVSKLTKSNLSHYIPDPTTVSVVSTSTKKSPTTNLKKLISHQNKHIKSKINNKKIENLPLSNFKIERSPLIDHKNEYNNQPTFSHNDPTLDIISEDTTIIQSKNLTNIPINIPIKKPNKQDNQLKIENDEIIINNESINNDDDMILDFDVNKKPKKVENILEDIQMNNVLPLKITKSLIDKLIHFMTNQKRHIVISLTVVPSRLGRIREVVNSLLNQSIPISQLYLIIPNRYKRKNEPYLIHKKWYFGSDERIKIVRTPDVGPMTKLHPILDLLNDNHIILTADDDHIYPRNWAIYLTYLAITKPNIKAIYCYKGYQNSKILLSNNVRQPTNLDWCSGEWGVCIAKKWIKDPRKMLKQVNFSIDAFYSDDVLISNHLAQYKVARILLPKIRMSAVYPKMTEWAKSYDGLQNMNPKPTIRYLNVLQTLKDKHHYFLNNKGPSFKINILTNPDGTLKEKEIPIGQQMALLPETLKDFKLTEFKNLNIRYISYLTDIDHPEWLLLYVKKLSNVSLELPKIDLSKVSLSLDYQQYVKSGPTHYDIIIIDIPYCLKKLPIQIKNNSDKQIYYIYRTPEIGNWHIIPHSVIVSQKTYGGHFYWKPELDVSVKNVTLKWNTVHKHLAMVITNNYYLSNLDFLFDFWNNHCNDFKITLHLCVVGTLHTKIQTMINELNISNIKLYNQSNTFATIIYNCNYYLQISSQFDHYANWAHSNNKSLIALKWGHNATLANIIDIPMTVGHIQICRPYLFEEHNSCIDFDDCALYGTKTIDKSPIINANALKSLFSQLFT